MPAKYLVRPENLALRSTAAEDKHFLEFARRWAPFGGPPNDEIFVRFGMPRPRYNRMVWESLVHHGIELQPESFRIYATAYPSPHANSYGAARPTLRRVASALKKQAG